MTLRRSCSLQNYANMFIGESGARFWNAASNTTIFALLTVTLETILGVTMALIMHRAMRGRGLVRGYPRSVGDPDRGFSYFVEVDF